MKRIQILFFVFLLILNSGVYAGGGQEREAEITLDLLDYYAPGSTGYEAVRVIVQNFLAQYPEIASLNPESVPRGEMEARVLRAALTGDLPEILLSDNPWTRAWGQAGVYYPLTDLLNEWGEWDSFFPGIRGNMTFDGNVYAVQTVTNNIALMYNRAIFSELGIASPPRTWAEVIEVSEIIARDMPGVTPIGFSAIDDEEATWQFIPVLLSNGGSLLELDQPEALEALEYWVELVNRGFAPSDVLGWGQGDLTPRFMNRQLAMIINGPWELDWRLPDMEDPYGISYHPTPSGLMPITASGGEAFGIGSSIPERLVPYAWKFIEYFMSEDVMVDFATRTGYLPTREGPLNRVLANDPRLQIFGEQAQFAVGRPAIGGGDRYPEVSAIMRGAIQSALSGAQSAQDALAEAAVSVRNAFDDEAHYISERDFARAIIDELLNQ